MDQNLQIFTNTILLRTNGLKKQIIPDQGYLDAQVFQPMERVMCVLGLTVQGLTKKNYGSIHQTLIHGLKKPLSPALPDIMPAVLLLMILLL